MLGDKIVNTAQRIYGLVTGAIKRRLAAGDNIPARPLLTAKDFANGVDRITGDRLYLAVAAISDLRRGHPAAPFLTQVGLGGRKDARVILGQFDRPFWRVEEAIRLTQSAEADRLAKVARDAADLAEQHRKNLKGAAPTRLEAAQAAVADLAARVAAPGGAWERPSNRSPEVSLQARGMLPRRATVSLPVRVTRAWRFFDLCGVRPHGPTKSSPAWLPAHGGRKRTRDSIT